VGDASMGLKGLLQVDAIAIDQSSELHNLADLLEGQGRALLVSIYAETCRVISAVFQSRKTYTTTTTRQRQLAKQIIAWYGMVLRGRAGGEAKCGAGIWVPLTRVSRMYLRSRSTK
jgi:hypothetical protein